ncbi:MAG: hypothetical protein K8I03_14600 [Ignavibacteria bacterium]|nr:hypothetical protein [Ignavibacteria bacterium]
MIDPTGNINLITGSKLIDELSRLSAQISKLSAEFSPLNSGTNMASAASSRGRNDETDITGLMLGNFEAMLGFTGSMLEDMGLMDTGFGKMLQSLLQFVSSLSGGGDFISTIGGLFGSIIGLFTGPAGIAAGAGSGVLNSAASLNSMATSQGTSRPVIVQNTIKNPVTFRRALEIETRVINNLNSVTAG